MAYALPRAAASAEVRPGVTLALSIGSKDGQARVLLAAEAAGAPNASQAWAAPPEADSIPEIQLTIAFDDGEARVVFSGELIDAQRRSDAATSSAAAALTKPPLPALRVGPMASAPAANGPVSQRPGRQPTARENVTARLQGGAASYLAKKRAAAAEAAALQEAPEQEQGGRELSVAGGNRTELQEAIARAQAAEGRAEAAEVRTPAAALGV